MTGREKEIVRHLSEDDLNRLLTETDDEKVSKRLIFVKRLYKGATLEDAADDVGMSQSTGSRWAKLWNKGGLGLLAPSFGGGRPRSSPSSNESVCLTCSKTVSLGRSRRFST
jgi:Transposase and inactivated derivatives